MPLHIIRNELTRMACDAVVNPTNVALVGTGGVDAKLHLAAGPELDAACVRIGHCDPGEAVLTDGYKLPARHVIHTVGPMWIDGTHGEAETLRSCYRASLAIALKEEFQTVAFPIIAAGTLGFPKDQALHIAVSEISAFLLQHEMTVYLVVYDSEVFQISKQLFWDIEEYIDEHYVQEHHPAYNARESFPFIGDADMSSMSAPADCMAPSAGMAPSSARPKAPRKKPRFSLKGLDRELDESFTQMLLRKIDERGMKDSECYKKANVDRKLFSKIRKDIHYSPSKPTVIAFAVALELDLEETQELLRKAGYALSHSNRFDVIIEYFIVHGNYDVFQINEALFAFDQSLLGA